MPKGTVGVAVPLALVSMVCYGVWAFFSGIAVETIPPETAAAQSYLVGGLVAVGFILYRGAPLVPSAEGTLYAVAAGVVIGIAVVAYYLALTRTSVGVATTIVALYFVIAALLEMIFLGRIWGISEVLGFSLAVMAIVLLVY